MKKTVKILLAFCAITASTYAQPRESQKKHFNHHLRSRIEKQLQFSEEQKKQSKMYQEDFKNKIKELNKNENITVKEFRDKRALLLKEHKAKMDGLLTVEQKTKIRELKAAYKAKAEERYAKHLSKMKSKLNLTEAQVMQMKTQKEMVQSKLKAIRENETLSREQKKERLMALKSETREQHKKIFTAEQLRKLEEMKKNRSERFNAK